MSDRQTEFAQRVREALGPDGVVEGAEACAPFERDCLGQAGRALLVLRPADAQQTAMALRLCAEASLTVVPQSGNTGLVGASIPDLAGQQVILSFARMDRIGPLDAENRSIRVEAGVRMSRLRAFLAAHGFWFPFEVAADPCIGGMIATNTAGSHVVRFGDLRHSVLGLEVVLPDGSRIDALTGWRKDNTGPDCKQLFIGSGGSYGVITRAVLEIQRQPLARVCALIVPHAHAALLALLEWVERRYGESLLSFEGLSGNAIRYACEENPDLRRVFPGGGIPDYAAMLELSSCGEWQAQSLAEAFGRDLAELAASSVVRVALTDHAAEYVALRQAVPRALSRLPRVIALDVAFSRSGLIPFRADLLEFLARRYPDLVLADFGHFADGGDHVTIVVPQKAAALYPPLRLVFLRSELYELVARHNGSFSAEHGIGPLNQSVYRKYAPQASRQLRMSLKRLLDPSGYLGRVRLA